MKRLVSFVMAVVLILTCLPLTHVSLKAGELPEQSGETKQWTLVTSEDWNTGGSFEENYWAVTSDSMTSSDLSIEATEDGLAINTAKQADHAWDAQAFFKITGEIKKGDTLFFGFKVKGISSGTDKISLNTRIRPSNDVNETTNFDITSATDGEWEQFYGSMVSTVDSADSANGYGTWVFQLGMAQQNFELADVFIVNVGQTSSETETGEAKIGTLVTCNDWNTGGYFGENYWKETSGSMTDSDLTITRSEDVLTINTAKKADQNWDAQAFFKITGEIKKGDTLFYGFKVKGVSSETSSDKISLNTRIRPSNDPNETTNFDITSTIDGEWEQFYGSMVSTVDSADSTNGYGTWVFQLGMAQQNFELADVFIVNVGQNPSGDDAENPVPGPDIDDGNVYTFEEIMQMYEAGKGELVTYPDALAEAAYTVQYQGNKINAGNFTVNQIDVANQNFDKALDITTTEVGDTAWDAQVFFNMDNTKKIEKDDVLFFGCKVRGISSVTNKEAMFVTANTRIRPDGSTSANFDITSSINADDENSWTQIFGAVAAPAASDDSKNGVWVFQLANAIQELQIADVFVINFGKEISVGSFPVMTKSYAGMEEDAQWRKDALARIEQIRKSDVSVKVVDEQGMPVENAEVRVEQTRHAFGFGTIVNVDDYSKMDASTQQKYKEAFSQIAHNRAGFENALKSNYITDAQRQVQVDDWLSYFKEKDIDVRGHVLIYGQDSRLNNVDMNGYKTDLANKDLLTADTVEGRTALQDWTANHINTYVTKYKGQIYNWDVVNENMTSHDWSDRLGGYDALVNWFEQAHEADPEAKLTYNDYGILSRDSGHQNYHYDLCKYLVDHDSAMTTIGIQGHVSLISPEEILSILDRFSTLGKEIEITEFTYEDDDPEFQAQFTRDFMIAVFSEEVVTSLTTWGFWEGCMYQPKAAMVDKNFNLKPNGQVWMDLVYDEWWTKESGNTDNAGIYTTRAFLGNHNVTIKANGTEYTYPLELDKNGSTLFVTLKNDGTVDVHSEHSYAAEWSSDASNHWHACICGEKADVGAHVESDWIVDGTADGKTSKHKECTVCGKILKTASDTEDGTKPGTEDGTKPGTETGTEDGTKPGTETVAAVKVYLTPALCIKKGSSTTLTASVFPKNTTDKITWSTSNKKVVTVTAKGKIKGIKKGTATITAKASNGKKAVCKVTVVTKNKKSTSVKLNVKSMTLNKGAYKQLKATITSKSTDKVTWNSSNKKVATVDKNGVVAGVKKGKATITAKTSSGKKATCKVTVKVPATKVTLNKTKATIVKGKTLTLKATVTPASSKETLTWSSSNKKVATVDGKGKVKALKKGKAVITVKTSNGKKATCNITVK